MLKAHDKCIVFITFGMIQCICICVQIVFLFIFCINYVQTRIQNALHPLPFDIPLNKLCILEINLINREM